MITDKELENMGKAIAEIGTAKTCVTDPIIKDTIKNLQDKGYDGAELYAAQLSGVDANTELLRVLKICRKYNLGKEAATKVLENLGKIESGKW